MLLSVPDVVVVVVPFPSLGHWEGHVPWHWSGPMAGRAGTVGFRERHAWWHRRQKVTEGSTRSCLKSASSRTQFLSSGAAKTQRLQLKHCDIEQRMNLCTLKLPAFKGNPRGQTPGIKL